MGILYRAANLTIALCYFAIPLWIWILYRAKKHDIPHSWYMLLFVAFILFCGFGHLCNYLVFEWPAYRFFTAVDVLTAMASVATVVCIPVVAKSLMDFPSWSEYAKDVESLKEQQKQNKRLINTMWELDAKNVKLIREREEEIQERDELIRELRHQIRNMEAPAQSQSDIRRLLQEKLEQIRQVGKKETRP